VERFVDALAYNWIIAGTDAHAKNYSVLLAGSPVRLAPLYDVASTLPYDDMDVRKLRMAMKIGGQHDVEATNGHHWRRFAQANKLDPEATIASTISQPAHPTPSPRRPRTRTSALCEAGCPPDYMQLPPPDCVGQVGHPQRRLRSNRLQGHAVRVHALKQADSGTEQYG
jgi:hypothetical protein